MIHILNKKGKGAIKTRIWKNVVNILMSLLLTVTAFDRTSAVAGIGWASVGLKLITGAMLLTSCIQLLLLLLKNTLPKTEGAEAQRKKQRDTTSPYVLLYYKRKTVSISMSLMLFFLLYILLAAISPESIGPIRTLVLLYIILLMIHQAVFSYRVKKGYYGCNKYEARKVLNYIIKHWDKNGGNGGRPILVDVETIYEYDYPPVLLRNEP